MSLRTVDDVPWGNVIQPRITMVAQDVDEIARVTSDFLLDRIRAGGAPMPARNHVLIPRLVIGQSCAPPSVP